SGQSGSATATVTVGGQSGSLTVLPGGPYSAAAGQPLTLSGSASGVPSGATATFTWTFGDAGTATGQTVTHTYTTGGSYTVTLTVSTSAGQSGSATTTATVSGSTSGQTEQVTLYANCNNISLTWPNSTPVTVVVSAINPSGSFKAMWRYDNARQQFTGY